MPYAPVFESLNRNKTLLSLCDYHLSEGLPCNPVYDAGSLALNIFLAQRHAWPRCGWQVHILSWAQPSGLHLCLQLSQYVSCRSFSAVCKVSFVNPACLMPPGYHVRGECRTQSAFVCKWLREDLADVYPSELLFHPCLCRRTVSSSVDRMWMRGDARHLLVFPSIGTCLLDFFCTLEIVISQIVILGAVEMVQSARCLLYKHKDFGIIPRTPVKIKWVMQFCFSL